MTATYEDLVDYDHLALYDEKIKQVIDVKADDADVIKSITVGGSPVTVTNNVAPLGSAAGKSFETTMTDGANLPTGSAIKTYVDDAIAAATTGAYKPAGSKAGSEMTSALLIAANLGNVYNLSTDITIAAADKGNWVENAENYYPAGTNVVVVDVGSAGSPSYKFDAQAGFVDLSSYVQFSDITIVTNAQINALFTSGS